MPKNFQQVSYSNFRHFLNLAAGRKVKNKGRSTFMYDQNNHMLAVLQSASIDTYGRTQPAQYFVRNIA